MIIATESKTKSEFLALINGAISSCEAENGIYNHPVTLDDLHCGYKFDDGDDFIYALRDYRNGFWGVEIYDRNDNHRISR